VAKSIKLKTALWEQLQKHAAKTGYSSVQELVEHLIDQELARDEEAEALAQVELRLKGLGYLD
jgi:hypothetical protein